MMRTDLVNQQELDSEKKREIRRFLKTHPIGHPSIATFADFQIRTLLNEDFNSELIKTSDKMMPGKLASSQEERKIIQNFSTPEEIVQQLRKYNDIGNMCELGKKALAMQESVIPLILDKYKTSANTHFIENATKILGNADQKYIEELYQAYKDIRSGYAQAIACYLFGLYGMIETIDLQMKEYERIRRLYPDKTYCDFQLLGLAYLIGEPEY